MKTLKTLSLIASLLALSVVAQADPLAVGAKAPEITAPNQDGKPVKFADVYAKGPTLVYFYPKADTPGCTKQACSLRDDYSKLQGKNIQVIGVSEDSADAQKKFQEKYTLPFTLIADTDGKVAAAFGVPMRGKVTQRQSFLIRDGKVVWNMLEKTSTDKHAADVLKAVEDTEKKS
jgi:peroxiredoxin Q/BCP